MCEDLREWMCEDVRRKSEESETLWTGYVRVDV